MLRRIAAFEFRYQFRQPLIWVAAILYFLLAFFAVTSDKVTIGGAIGAVHRNAPYVILQIMGVMSVLGTFFTTAFVSNSVHRDFELQTDALFFSMPISKRDYLLGRFSGSLVLAWFGFLAIALGIAVGSLMPWLDPARVGPFVLTPYLYTMLVFVLPNLFITGAIFFSVATLTRNLLYTYAGVVIFLTGTLTASNFINDVEHRTLASIIDPYGLEAFDVTSRYWTVAERNTLVPSLQGGLLLNRLLWVGLGAALLAFTLWRFQPLLGSTGKARRRRAARGPIAPPLIATGSSAAAAAPTAPTFGPSTSLAQFRHQARIETLGILKGIPFIVMLLFALINVVASSSIVESLFGTPVLPVTGLFLRLVQGSFSIFALLILIFYAGELVWRERTLRMAEMFDALPMPTWTIGAAKLTALGVASGVMLLSAMLAGLGVQMWHGYTHFEIPVFLKGLFLVQGPPYLFLAIACLFFQVLCNNKFLGWLLGTFFLIQPFLLPAMRLEHRLYRFAALPDAPYSDMNGFSPFVQPILWLSVYWGLVCVVMFVVSLLLWPRGTESRFRLRLRVARQRWTLPVTATVAAALLGIVGSGGWIYYNTCILNRYTTQDGEFDRQADYEKQYRKYNNLAMPRLTDAKVDVDIYPERRAADFRGQFRMENKAGQPIDTLHLSLNRDVVIRKLDVPGGTLQSEDARLGYRIFKLDPPLPPGAVMTVSFDLGVAYPGFVNSGVRGKIVQNGTFFDSSDFLPHLGYQATFELQDPNERRKRGLPPVQRLPKLEDEAARRNSYISNEADWVTYESTVSTGPDQIALASGELLREWTENGRHYFHYKTDAPILDYYSWMSARYTVKRDHWSDPAGGPGVELAVYYHKEHPYNVDRMIEGMKKSLDYFTANFGPYQHKELRIAEFPNYARFAQAMPNLIPFSESIGFIARLNDDPEAIDYPFYVTAHEVGHMWWAHQVIGANAQGATLMSETMAQYSALMVMEHEYGSDKMHRFLKYELDNYLRGRGQERIEELPLYRVENQPYVHYRKGSLVLYALRDTVGEEALNAALKAYVHDVRFQQPPYTTSLQFLDYVKRAVPEDRAGFLDDMFRNITLYENKATKATWAKRDDGKYLVRIQIASNKYRADGQGNETSRPLDDFLDIGVFGAKGKDTPPEGKVLALEKRHVTKGEDTIEFVVDEQPVKAGIDPFNKMIDRNPDNNLVAAEQGAPGKIPEETPVGQAAGGSTEPAPAPAVATPSAPH
jgi:ABC-type transport system involved in multi-copper enzyme maturation permease subunit